MSMLTFAERCAWIREVWDIDVFDKRWVLMERVVGEIMDERNLDAGEFVNTFYAPEKHPQLVDALFNRYLELKLVGETM